MARAMSTGVGLLLGRLDELRDHLTEVRENVGILGDADVREKLADEGAEYVAAKTRASLQTRFQRLASAVYEDAKKFARVERTLPAVIEVATEIVGDAKAALDQTAERRHRRRLISAGVDEPDDDEPG